ncbi:hypothetical protein MRX96_057470 [Rhipicephalus microplus]
MTATTTPTLRSAFCADIHLGTVALHLAQLRRTSPRDATPQSQGRRTTVDTPDSRMTNVSSSSGNLNSSPAFPDQRLSRPEKGKQVSGVCLCLGENDSATAHPFDSLQGVASVD